MFTGRVPTPATVEAVEAMAKRLPEIEWLVVCGEAARGPWLGSKLRRLRRQPLSYPLELLYQLASKLRSRRRRVVTGGVGLPALQDLERVSVARFDDLNGDECRAAVRAFEPWLGVAIGPPILREELFEIPADGTINLHKSLLPEYRGMPPGFWELHDGAKSAGVSVHRVVARLDAGDVLLQREVGIEPYESIGGLQARLDAASIDVLVEAIEQCRDGAGRAAPQGVGTTPTRGRPAFLVERAVRRRLARRRAAASGEPSGLRRFAKAAVLRAWLHAWVPLRNLWRRLHGTCHTTILLYHRVSDEFVDSVTVGVEQFHRQLQLIKRGYDVLDLQTWLEQRGQPRRRPAVVLTFDDGYADNHLAAMLLRREALPCTFFICTQIVGTDAAFPQDQQKLGRTVPALTWHQVRDMSGWGFTFGNHTTRHLNLAELPRAEALAEVAAARGDLEQQLGATGAERWLAFPYGRPANMRDDIRGELPTVGTEFCFSAHGGVNGPDFAHLDILRQGVNAGVPDLTLRAMLEGWRPR